MRLLVNSNDRISGTNTDFTVKYDFLPEDRNKKFKVYIQQVVIRFDSTFADNRNTIYLSSKSITPYNDYNTRYNDALCLLIRSDNNGYYHYQNNGPIENFSITNIQGQLNFQIHDLDIDDALNDLAIIETSIILNLIEE